MADPMTTGDEYRVPASPCYQCGMMTDGAGGQPTCPRPMDIGVCVGCHAVSLYADDLTMRQPTAAEQADIDNDADIQRAIRMLKNQRDRRKW